MTNNMDSISDDIKLKMIKRMYRNINDAVDLVADFGPDVLPPKEVLQRYIFPAMKEFDVKTVPAKWKSDYDEWVVTEGQNTQT